MKTEDHKAVCFCSGCCVFRQDAPCMQASVSATQSHQHLKTHSAKKMF